MSDYVITAMPAQLHDWYFSGTVLDCYGSATAIKSINIMTREVELPFRDGTVFMSFEDAARCLKPATAATKIGSER